MSRRLARSSLLASLLASLALNAFLLSWVISPSPDTPSALVSTSRAPACVSGELGHLPPAAPVATPRGRSRGFRSARAPLEAQSVRGQEATHGEHVQNLGSDSSVTTSETSLKFLPDSKREQIEELQLRMAEQLLVVTEAGDLDATTWVEMQQDQEAAIEELLTDDELFEYTVRASDSARSLRALLRHVEVTEEEFRQLVALRTTFDEEVRSRDERDSTGGEEAGAHREAARARAESSLNEGFRSILGDERYRQFRYESALRSSSLRRVAMDYGLPRESVYGVLEIAEAAREAADRLRKDPHRTPETRRGALDALRAETEREVAVLIGDEAAQSYIETDLSLRTLDQPVLPESVRALTEHPAF